MSAPSTTHARHSRTDVRRDDAGADMSDRDVCGTRADGHLSGLPAQLHHDGLTAGRGDRARQAPVKRIQRALYSYMLHLNYSKHVAMWQIARVSRAASY